jgi:CHAT domain-containing protein
MPPLERERQTFDLLQRFKARTLHERMAGPGRAPGGEGTPVSYSPVTLEYLQADLLREGELFLDLFLGPDHSLLFAVTRQELRVVDLPGEDSSLGDKLRLFRDLLATPPEGAKAPGRQEILAAASRSMALLLLGNVEDLLGDARIVILSPDGSVNLVPLSALQLPGHPPLIESHEVVRVPSATLLAELRSRTGGDPSGRGEPRVLAIAGSRTAEGKILEGAIGEVREIAKRYRGVELLLATGPEDTSLSVADLGQYDLLHLAAHTTVDDQHPWRSGVLLTGGTETRPPNYLRASEIASLRLATRMAVLSGCESAGGRVLSGEGVLGLTSALLSAGVPTVVATLWPVEDRTTARLMKEY